MDEKIVDTGLEMMAVRLSMLRLDSKKRQKAVANDLDIKPQVLAYYEKGKRHPDFKTLCSLARYYNVSVDYLLGNSDEVKNLTCFSIKLKELRKERKLTQIQLAEILETSKQSIWNYEASHREPNIKMIIKIAKYFNVSADYILGNSKHKNSLQANH